jgi:hypothetical protein
VAIVGNTDLIEIEESTSNVDQGEPGKVKGLYDLVFGYCEPTMGSGLAIKANRGDSLDIGFLHDETCISRKKCTIEFWFYLPSKKIVLHDIVLARRSFGEDGDDMKKILLASYNAASLWQVVLRSNGEIVFNTHAGSEVRSSFVLQARLLEEEYTEDNDELTELAGFQKWNHICLVFSSMGLDVNSVKVAIYLKGVQVATDQVHIYSEEKGAHFNDLMQKSQLVFGLSHCEGFRMTELRVWACERSQEDIASYLYEYLSAAEQKKKFKVKISGKNNKGSHIGKGIGLVPPKPVSGNQKLAGLVPPRDLIADKLSDSTVRVGFSIDDNKTQRLMDIGFLRTSTEHYDSLMPLTPSKSEFLNAANISCSI